jgi:hypothetical protein
MQQFLPMLGIEEPRWEARTHGHSGNWRKGNVEFCLSTFLDLVLKLQHAAYQPSAVEFSVLFDDVVTAKHDGVLVSSQHRHPLFYGMEGFDQEHFDDLKKGQWIKGHLIPAFQSGTFKWEETSFEYADLYVMERAKIETEKAIPEHTVLIVKAEDVEWSFKEQENIREHLPHFFDSEEK